MLLSFFILTMGLDDVDLISYVHQRTTMKPTITKHNELFQ